MSGAESGSSPVEADDRVLGSLHVADLDPQIEDTHLLDVFNIPDVCAVKTLRIVRDRENGIVPRYAYVNYETEMEARRARERLNFTKILGREIRISFTRASGAQYKSRNDGSNLYIKNLDYSVDSKELYNIFCQFGEITSCRVMQTADGQSRGFGFVAFESSTDARKAMQLDGTPINDKVISVTVAHQRRKHRLRRNSPPYTCDAKCANFAYPFVYPNPSPLQGLPSGHNSPILAGPAGVYYYSPPGSPMPHYPVVMQPVLDPHAPGSPGFLAPFPAAFVGTPPHTPPTPSAPGPLDAEPLDPEVEVTEFASC